MSKLPFVVQPRRQPIIERIGSEESGYIEIERRGYLTSGEKAFVQQAISSDDGTLKIINLARKIGNKTGASIESGYNDVMSILGGNPTKDPRLASLEVEYFTEFTELLNGLTILQSKEELITSLCLMMYRINADIKLEDAMELHPDIIKGLAVLYKEEEAKSTKRFDEQDADNEEKKPELSGDERINELEKKRTRRTVKTD